MAKATKVKLLSFSMKDRAGLLFDITSQLVRAKVNITAICAYAIGNDAYFDMTTESNAKARKVLAGLGIKVEEEDVIAVEMANKTGELHKVAKALAQAGINISYMYGTAASARTSTCLFSTSDNRKALRAINR